MEGPQVENKLKDEASGVTYSVLAYRRLSQDEIVQSIGFYLSRARKKPKRGSVVTIVSIVGANE
jgi:hypothetical protein